MSSPLDFRGVRITRSLVSCAMSCRSLFVLMSFFFWPLCCQFFCLLAIVLSVLLSFGHCVVSSSVFWPLSCLSFFDLRILITPFVSSNSSCHTQKSTITCLYQICCSIINKTVCTDLSEHLQIVDKGVKQQYNSNSISVISTKHFFL
jgi:hypothetical protein